MRVLAGLCAFSLLLPGSLLAQESFKVELDRDGKTIADMRPVFLKFESRPLPAISPAEVGRRYQRLFETSDEPEVRVDALNRLSNIRLRSGEDVGYSADQEPEIYREAIASYESILDRGSFSGRLDELLYQMAKAHALTGHTDASTERLRQLVGLFPDSPLVPESRFRIAEAEFSAGKYARAETSYQTLIKGEGGEALKSKARYMLGWSQFKQGAGAWDRAAATFLDVLDGFLPTEASLGSVAQSSVDTIDDTLRILAVMASRKQGVASLEGWLGNGVPRPWVPLVYDRLADLYAVTGEPSASVRVNRRFVQRYPDHRDNPEFLNQVVQVWRQAGMPEAARDAKADYVAAYLPDDAYKGLDRDQQRLWQQYARTLADYHYHSASERLAAKGEAVSGFARAADYYESLARRQSEAGSIWRLAGDARLQAGEDEAAINNFRTAAYQSPGYPEAADSAWAAITLYRKRVPSDSSAPSPAASLSDLSAEIDRFASVFPSDSRMAAAQADLATRWYANGDYDRAIDYAHAVTTRPDAGQKAHYSAWLVKAKVRQARQQYAEAERAWRQTLTMIDDGNVPGTTGNDRKAVVGQLAAAIYQQGQTAASAGEVSLAVAHFQRIETLAPGSEMAIRGRFDAANTLLKASEWQTAINELRRFRRDYPDHDLTSGIGEKLVYAYTESDQPVRAAEELLAMAETREDAWPLRLRAADLLHDAGDVKQRNALYVRYLDTRPRVKDADSHIRLQTMRQRLTESVSHPEPWQKAMVQAELSSDWHSEETLRLSARSAMALGIREADTFASIPLTQPLASALDRKQAALEAARTYFVQAQQFGGEAVESEVLYRRAELYRQLAADLMASTVPSDLNEMEAMQYQMLLEEQAYPFEEKAIALHAKNHGRIVEHGFDPWIGRSLEVLGQMNPGRYDRSVRWMSWNSEGNDGA